MFLLVSPVPSADATHPAYEPLNKIKAPKALADGLGWIEQALSEFGIAGLSLRGLIEFLKGKLKDSNAAVRTSATKTLVMVKLFAGSSIVDLLGNLNPRPTVLAATVHTLHGPMPANRPNLTTHSIGPYEHPGSKSCRPTRLSPQQRSTHIIGQCRPIVQISQRTQWAHTSILAANHAGPPVNLCSSGPHT